MSERRICKYCGMELSEDVPHGLRQCHLHAVTRITELEAKKDILENQLSEATNFLIDKKLHVDSLYEDGFKLQKRIDELEAAQARWVMVSERLPNKSGWYRVGAIDVFDEGYTDEVYFDANKTELGWHTCSRNEIYCWLDGVPELPQPPEVQQ